MPESDTQSKFRIPHPSESNANAIAALRLFELNYPAIPLEGKAPKYEGWQDPPDRRAFMRQHLKPDGNIGIVCGTPAGFSPIHGPIKLTALDLDFTIPDAAEAARSLFKGYPIRIGEEPKFLVPVRTFLSDSYSHDYSWVRGNETAKLQVLGQSATGSGPRQFAAFGIHPGTKEPYEWIGDSEGRTIFDMRPEELPGVLLKNVFASLNEVLEPLGFLWKPKAEYEGHVGGFDPKLIDKGMVDDANQLIDAELAELAQLGPGERRGTRSHQLGLSIGAVIKAGFISMDGVVARLRAAMPDNDNAWTREFQNGVRVSMGDRQRTIYERTHPDYEAAAKAQGINFEDLAKGAKERAEEFAQEDRDADRDVYRRALVEGVLNLMANVVRKTDLIEQAEGEKLCWGFMQSLLAAEMTTIKELADLWAVRAAQLHHTLRCREPAKNVMDAIPSLQPSEAGWALRAATFMGGGMEVTKAIYTARVAPAGGGGAGGGSGSEGLSPEAQEIIKSVGMLDWDREDPNDLSSDAQGRSFSNFTFLLAACLDIWPFYDEFVDLIVFRRLRGVGPVTDQEIERLNTGLEAAVAGVYALATDRRKPWGVVNYSPKVQDVELWLKLIAQQRRFNSVVQALEAWPAWDGRDRLGDWLARFAGHRPGDPDYRYVCAAGAHFMKNWVARMLRPGHKFDEVLALGGLEGPGKTSLFGILCDTVAPGSYLAGQEFQFDTSTGINRVGELTRGKLMAELAELKGLHKRDAERMKAMISNTADTGRASYGRDTYTKKRQFTLVGTFNCTVPGRTLGEVTAELGGVDDPAARDARVREIMQEADVGFLVDPTGTRRFMPVTIMRHRIDFDALAAEAPRLIAQAKAEALAADFQLYAMPDMQAEVARASEKFFETHGLEDEVAAALEAIEAYPDVKIAATDLRRVLGLRVGSQGRALAAAASKNGLLQKKNNVIFYYRGDWDLAQRIVAFGPNGSAKLVLSATISPGAAFGATAH